jgi:hypothetical protein
MIRSDRHRESNGRASTVVWNVVVPALGLALILGASMLPAFALAGVAAIAIHAVEPRRKHWRLRAARGVVARRVLREP